MYLCLRLVDLLRIVNEFVGFAFPCLPDIPWFAVLSDHLIFRRIASQVLSYSKFCREGKEKN